MSNTLKRLITKANYRPTLNVVSTDILSRSFAGETSAFSLPDLPYEYNDLEPVLPTKIMELHHSKHHQTYVNNLNASLQKRDDAIAKLDIATVVALDGAIKFNGGGHVNHSIFWNNLTPIKNGGGQTGTTEIGSAIAAKWGSIDKFIEVFNAQTAAVQGSGWGWLVCCPKDGLKIITMPNQDPVGSLGVTPIIGIDVW
eukprot:CAMPEP_0114656902 /NCGR_PEP_ID=MMETSP0191-20121206/13056_1 /TAXON_ID=126664 /ORGANISM="Sorites sp." /LENGTH=197 /DNA_ID=CAMNT_0001875077 /DNA_START=39 /DNA_END=629 /DNA_ORIENTATION=+